MSSTSTHHHAAAAPRGALAATSIASLKRSRRGRGFTLVEMLAVIAIIGIILAAAAPSFTEAMSDRRVNDCAQQIADMYRSARSRAMGRGAATVVRWNAQQARGSADHPAGHFMMKEAVQGGDSSAGGSYVDSGAERLPVSSCFAPDWSKDDNAPENDTRVIAVFDERLNRYNPAAALFMTAGGDTRNFTEICYTPRGRTFIREAAGDVFAAMTSVPRIQVMNSKTGRSRVVVLPPTGVARVVAAPN